MRRKSLFIFCLFVICIFTNNLVFAKEVILDGITYSLEDRTIEFDKEGKVWSGTLEKDTIVHIQGVECKLRKGCFVMFYPNGKLRRAPIVNGVILKVANKSVRFMHNLGLYENGGIAWVYLSDDIYLPVGDKQIKIKASYHELFPSGGADIKLYETGEIKRCYLAKEVTYILNGKKITFKKRQHITYYKNGKILRCYLPTDVKLRINNMDEVFRKGINIFLTQEGDVFGIKLKDDKELIIHGEKKVIPKNTYISFSDYQNKIVDAIGIPSINLDDYINIKINADNRLVWVRFSDSEMEKANSILFMEETNIDMKGQKKLCKPFEWILVE